MSGCIKCGDTGIRADGTQCDCSVELKMVPPSYLKIPPQYQSVKFDKKLLRKEQQTEYGNFMEKLLRDCTDNNFSFHKNVLVCAPPNSGKTIWSYTACSILYAKGVKTPALMDIVQVRNVLLSYYGYSDEDVSEISNARFAVFKIPMDLPNKFAETILTIIERRVRAGGSTVFLYSGSWQDLQAQDTFGKLKFIVGDGSYNSLSVNSFY
jgi:hypothetical protein